MQNWSPEPFTAVVGGNQSEQDADWRGEQEVSVSAADRLYRKDNWGNGTGSLQDLLTPEERQELHRQIEDELAESYRQRLAESQADQVQANEAWLTRFAADIQDENNRKIQEMARNTGALAIALAERILRRAVQLDREVLSRAIEVLLMKVEADSGLELRVHPDDAEYLGNHDELQQELNIAKITLDRRIERGGCLAKADDQMWDATLQGQLEALAEVVNEIMTSENPSEETAGDEAEPPLA